MVFPRVILIANILAHNNQSREKSRRQKRGRLTGIAEQKYPVDKTLPSPPFKSYSIDRIVPKAQPS
jgi:hypothetical protein